MRRGRILIAQRRGERWSRFTPSNFSIEEVSQMPDLIEAMVNRKPAVLLLANDFPGLNGPAGVREIRRLSPATKIIVLSRTMNQPEELEVLRMGAKGYWGATETEVLLKMIDKVQQGEIWAGRRTIGALLEECASDQMLARGETDLLVQRKLEQLTFRESEILRLLGDGASNKEIASALNVSVSTVKAHLTKIFRKLDQPDRVHLALYAAAAPHVAG